MPRIDIFCFVVLDYVRLKLRRFAYHPLKRINPGGVAIVHSTVAIRAKSLCGVRPVHFATVLDIHHTVVLRRPRAPWPNHDDDCETRGDFEAGYFFGGTCAVVDEAN